MKSSPLEQNSVGNKLAKADKMINQPLPPKDDRVVSVNPSPDAAITGPSRNAIDHPTSGDAVVDTHCNSIYPFNNFGSLEQTYYYGGYDSGASSWSGYPQFAGVDGLHIVPPVVYGDNSSLGLHSPYSFTPLYGQYSPATTPIPQLLVDNQLFPQYYPQVASSMPHIDVVTPKGHMMNTTHGHGFYNLHGQSNAADIGWGMYTHPMGTFGSFDPTLGQTSQQRPYHGYGLASELVGGAYPYDLSFQSSHFGVIPNAQQIFNYQSRLNLDKTPSQREQESLFVISGDRNRGPRATKAKGKGTTGNGSLSGAVENNDVANSTWDCASASGLNLSSYNSCQFPSDYENAKFFIIKSFSEDNIHRSIKYGVWASTPHGNKKLDTAFQEAKEKGNCPVFLLFSVNGSGQFCGVAEMTGPVDFEKSADYWQQDRWSGQFDVRWHIIKDVPNNNFRHILLENNDNKPVTHSRDSQEVKLEQGIEMLKIFKEYDAQTSILDDFEFYEEREKVLQESKSRQQAKPKPDIPESSRSTNEMLNNISDSLDKALHLEETCKDVVADDNNKGSDEQHNVKSPN